ncbi:hypothetical protein AZA_08894 [Nitrospirillum viridazoti Y2]|nr:hypothetical protein AZA_08894 [Nitrospirillum amazonense Y2]
MHAVLAGSGAQRPQVATRFTWRGCGAGQKRPGVVKCILDKIRPAHFKKWRAESFGSWVLLCDTGHIT